MRQETGGVKIGTGEARKGTKGVIKETGDVRKGKGGVRKRIGCWRHILKKFSAFNLAAEFSKCLKTLIDNQKCKLAVAAK